MQQNSAKPPLNEGSSQTSTPQTPWEADLQAITAQGFTDAKALFSFGQRRNTPPPPTVHPYAATFRTPVKRPDTSYLIIATPRSGSFMLCDALVHTNLAGRPTEYFTEAVCRDFFQRWHISSYANYLEGVFHLGQTSNGVFGAKICWTDMNGLITNLQGMYKGDRPSAFELLSRTFPNLQYIWITRRDKVRQAISYWRASWTREWLRLKGDKQGLNPPKEIDFQVVDSMVQNLVEYEKEIEEYFSRYQIQPYIVCYEDFVTTYQETTLGILDFLHVSHSQDVALPEPTLEKQSDAWSEEMVQRYHQLLAE